MSKNRKIILFGIVAMGIWVIGAVLIYAVTEKENDAQSNLSEMQEDGINSKEDDANTSYRVKKLVFIHHSTGENWLSDSDGELGKALADKGYYVSDTNYGWGLNGIGDTTDIGHWWLWFRDSQSTSILSELYKESEQHSQYTRLEQDPGGENTIIMFKSCFPNSDLKGSEEDPIPNIDYNPLKGKSGSSEYHTISNAKGIYIDILEYFETRQDKLFIVITAPPLGRNCTLEETANNARAFNNWLKNDWLNSYDYNNVAVFDFYNILTNHGQSNYSEFSTDESDDHPNTEGNKTATEEFIPFLNEVYAKWIENK